MNRYYKLNQESEDLLTMEYVEAIEAPKGYGSLFNALPKDHAKYVAIKQEINKVNVDKPVTKRRAKAKK